MRARNEGSVYQLANGKWQASISIGRGKYVRRNAKTQAEAVKILNQLKRQRDDGEQIVDVKLTVADLLEAWRVKNMPNRGYVPNNTAAVLGHLFAWKEHLGKTRVAKLTVPDVENAMTAMTKASVAKRGKPLARETMTKRRSTLGLVFDAAIRRGDMTKNPARLAELPAGLAGTDKRRAFTVKQAERIIAATRTRRNGAAYLIGLSLAPRPGELFGLRWDAIDFQRNTITFRYGLQMHHGKPLIVDRLKNEGSWRTLVMPEFVAAALREHKLAQNKERLAASEWDDPSIVFPTQSGRPMDMRNHRRDFANMVNALGYGDDWKPNEMRHTAASLLLHRGMPREKVADMLGHGSTRMLDKHYRHGMQPAEDAHLVHLQSLFGEATRAK